MAKRSKSREQSAETPSTDAPLEPPANIPVANFAEPPHQQGDAYEPPAASAANETFPPGDEPRKYADDNGPRGVRTISLGDGRKIHFVRHNAMQQAGIYFSAPEGQDAKPLPEDTAFLKQRGFMWRGREGMWTRQLISRQDKEEIEAIEADKGPQQARMERGRRRADCDRECENVYMELANKILVRNGQEPKDYTFSQERER